MKSHKDRDKERLIHIKEAIEKIERYSGELTEKAFIKDSKSGDAILFQLSIIGEAMNHVDRGILAQYNYPWHAVRAQRNVIAHEYFGIRMDKIWSVVKDDLPGLKLMIMQVLEDQF